MIKVSVIVPVYNVEHYLEACLKSLVNQTLEELEIILIDDGSTDQSLNIIKQYKELYPEKIKYKAVENGGAASARNIGLGMATGEYIGFVDSDDYVDLTMYEKMYNCAVKEQADIVKCGYNRIDLDDIQQRDVAVRKCFGHSVIEAPAIYINNVPYIWNKLFKKSLIEQERARFETSLRIFEDLVFLYKLYLKANKIVQVPETLYSYTFSRDGSLTNVFSEKRFDIFPAFEMLIEYFKNEDVYYHFEEELMYLLLNHIFVVFDNPIRYQDVFLKFKFINQAFSFMKEHFPSWKKSHLYFEKNKKSKFLYTKKFYWYIKSLIPKTILNGLREIRKLKKNLNFSRAGAQYYKYLRKTKVVDNRILILSQQGKNLNGSMFYILKELCSNPAYDSYDIAVAYDKTCYDKFSCLMQNYALNKNNVRLVELHSKSYAQYLATAKYLFNDTSFSVYFIKRAEQVYLNTWHGTPLKTLGKSTAEDFYDIANVQKNFINADYLLYPSEYMKKHMIRDYMMEPIFNNKVLMAGYPRNEIFFDSKRGLEIRRTQQLQDKTWIGYMPTWRGTVRGNKNKQKEDIKKYLQEIDRQLNESQVMFVNLHPYLANDLSYDQYKHILPFPEQYETYDFLNACDVLVTDYSSVMFDYAITNRKIVLFVYDEKEYFSNRGVYVTLDELPFMKAYTATEVVTAINDEIKIDYAQFLEKYCKYDNANITEQICAKVILNKQSNVVCESYTDNRKDLALLYCNSFSQNIILETKDLCEKTNLDTPPFVYYTYDTSIMRYNKNMMKLLPEKVSYWGRLNLFSTMSLAEAIALYLLKKNAFWCNVFDKSLKKLFEREGERSFGNVDFKANIIIGKETSETIELVSRLKGKKVMYLISSDDINFKVPKKVYNRYDHIYVKDEKIKDIMLRNGITAPILVGQGSDLKAMIEE